MIEFYQCDANKASEVADMFDIAIYDTDRCYVMTEDRDLGFSVLRLVNSKIEIAQVKLVDGLDFGYYDLLFRSTLNALTHMPDIQVYIGDAVQANQSYCSQFGFVEDNGKLIVNTNNIEFPLCGGDK